MVCQMLQHIEVIDFGLTSANSMKHIQHFLSTYPAGSTFAAGLRLHKFKKILSHINHTGIFIHHDKTAGTHYRAYFLDTVVINLIIEILCRYASPRWATHLCCFELASLRYTTTNIEDDFAERGSHRNFHQSRIIDPARKCKNLRSFAFLG